MNFQEKRSNFPCSSCDFWKYSRALVESNVEIVACLMARPATFARLCSSSSCAGRAFPDFQAERSKLTTMTWKNCIVSYFLCIPCVLHAAFYG